MSGSEVDLDELDVGPTVVLMSSANFEILNVG
jgi:hypothetical protein